MDLGLTGRVAIVTGASSGIGRAIALAFAAEGCHVVLTARTEDALRAVVDELPSGSSGLVVVGDVRDPATVDRLVAAASNEYGRLDILVNNAGRADAKRLEALTDADWIDAFDLLLFAAVRLSAACVPVMRAAAWGRIINVASALADRAIPLLSTYSASKAALKSFSDSLRMELRATSANVDVVTILPSSVNTPFYQWGSSKLGVRPHPVSVIYPPRAVAEAIVSAAERPQREIFVGVMGKLLSVAERLSPAATDWYMLQRRYMFREQYSTRPDAGESNLFRTPDESAVDGDYPGETRKGSVYTRAVELRPWTRRVAAAGMLAAAAMLVRTVSRRSRGGSAAPSRPRLRLASSARQR